MKILTLKEENMEKQIIVIKGIIKLISVMILIIKTQIIFKEEKKEKTFTPKLESKPEEKKENKQDDNKENKESIKLFDETPTPNPLFDIKEKKEKIKLPTLTIKEEDNEQITEKYLKDNKLISSSENNKKNNNNFTLNNEKTKDKNEKNDKKDKKEKCCE